MVNLTYIEHKQRFCHHFSMSNLACCKFVVLNKNTLSIFLKYFSNQVKHTQTTLPRLLSMGGSGFVTKGETGKDSPHSYPKFWTSNFFWVSLLTKTLSPSPFLHAWLSPSDDYRPYIKKSLIACRIFNQKRCLWGRFSDS